VELGAGPVSQQILHPLEYASPTVGNAAGGHFRASALLFALLGGFMNVVFIAGAIANLHNARCMYYDLARDPRVYNREVAQSTILALRRPIGLWASELLMIASGAFGLLLAVHLFVAVLRLRKRPGAAVQRLREYAHWKPVGAIATTGALFWSGVENTDFFEAATRHGAIDFGPPLFVWAAVLLGCALLPLWWVCDELRRTAGAHEFE
jgi:hypothetical protein